MMNIESELMPRHLYAVQLVRQMTDPVLDRTEKIALEKICETYSAALEYAFKFGAVKNNKRGGQLPRVEGTRAVFPCRDTRFARVQIVIRAT